MISVLLLTVPMVGLLPSACGLDPSIAGLGQRSKTLLRVDSHKVLLAQVPPVPFPRGTFITFSLPIQGHARLHGKLQFERQH